MKLGKTDHNGKAVAKPHHDLIQVWCPTGCSRGMKREQKDHGSVSRDHEWISISHSILWAQAHAILAFVPSNILKPHAVPTICPCLSFALLQQNLCSGIVYGSVGTTGVGSSKIKRERFVALARSIRSPAPTCKRLIAQSVRLCYLLNIT